jgi:hypothetical protein
MSNLVVVRTVELRALLDFVQLIFSGKCLTPLSAATGNGTGTGSGFDHCLLWISVLDLWDDDDSNVNCHMVET